MNKLSNLSIIQSVTAVNSDIDVPWSSTIFNDIQPFFRSFFPNSDCKDFLAVNHGFFQLANVFFLLSYFAPSGKCGIIYLRFMLMIGCVFFAIWGVEILCAVDVLIWNLIFIVCNIIHIIILVVQMWPIRFSKEIEDVSTLSRNYISNQESTEILNIRFFFHFSYTLIYLDL